MIKIKTVVFSLTIVLMSFFAPLVSISSFASVEEKESFSGPNYMPPVTNYVQFENKRKDGKPRGRGSWRQGPQVKTPSTSGSISKVITDTFTVTGSVSAGIPNDYLYNNFQVSFTRGKSITSTCVANVGTGKTISIKYRSLYQPYKIDKVVYRIIPGGGSRQEISRTTITVYVPVDIEFKW